MTTEEWEELQEDRQEELEKILEEHASWLKDNSTGKRADLSGMCLIGLDLSGRDLRGVDLSDADLRGANLQSVDLRGANLSDADFSGANLSPINPVSGSYRPSYLSGAKFEGTNFTRANLSCADLHGADLKGTNLMDADLCSANLRGAKLPHRLNCVDFTHADLRGADLRNADLSVVNLSYSDLRGADLKGTGMYDVNLYYADLRGANYLFGQFDKDTMGVASCCPAKGSFIAYKKVDDKIIVLEIPADAKRVSGTTFRCRCDKAKVLRIENFNGKIADEKSVSDNDMEYTVGKIVSVKNFDIYRWNEDGEGITFYISRVLARIRDCEEDEYEE